MVIDVTAEDIEKGERSVCGRCPVALAAERAGVPGAAVNWAGNISSFKDGVEIWWRHLPDIAIQFVSDFDNGRPVRPFSFELDA